MILFLVFIGLILLVLSVIAISSIKILRGIDMLRSAVSSGFEFLFAEFEDLEDKLVDISAAIDGVGYHISELQSSNSEDSNINSESSRS